MQKYIDVGVLKEWIENWLYKDRYYHNGRVGKTIPITELYDILEQLPTADVPDRKVGKWIHGREIAREKIGDCITAIFYDGWKCSECECIVEEEREPLWNYCPNCGARVKGEDDEHTGTDCKPAV